MTRFAVLAAFVAGCSASQPSALEPAPDAGCPGCADGSAAPAGPTPATLRANLYANLFAQMNSSATLFGQQRFNLTGVADDGSEWLAAPGELDRSDAHTVSGHHPAVLGFDAWDLAIKPANWAPTGALHADAAKHVYAAGGVVTMEFHQHGCAVDSFAAAGNEACLCRIANDDAFARTWLIDAGYAKVADALVANGLDRIPIIFRPLHEHTGGWFWWGAPYWNCSAYVASPRYTGDAAFAQVFQRIVTYLRVERGLDNLLIAYSPAGDPQLASEQGYLRGYPGDAYVDILGADLYYQRSPDFATQSSSFAGQLATITHLAYERVKVAAITEIGNTQLAFETSPSQSTWYGSQLLPLLRAPGVAVAYALTWENRTSGDSQFWVPYATHPGAADFRAFEASDATTFLDDVPPLYDVPQTAYPVCMRCDSDPDGDRWGWENQRSCRVGSWCL